jgi:ribosomal protein S27AE
MQKIVFCPNCQSGFTVGEQVGGKLMLAAAGYAVGGKLDPWAALLATLVGGVLGHVFIDSKIRTCPQCGQLVNIANELL